jgi:hypothetical protein
VGLTVNNAGTRVEISTDGANRHLLIGLPPPFRHNSGSMATDVNGGSNFGGRIIFATKIYKHLHSDSNFLPAQEASRRQLVSFGPGGPTPES